MSILSLEPARIILVEDDFALAQHTHRTLRDLERVEVVVCADFASAHAAMDRPFDVIVSDYNLPDGTGADVLELARRANPDAPRILVTAQAEWTTAERCVNDGGAFRVLAKPWTAETLLDAVADAVDLKRLLDRGREGRQIDKHHQLEIAEANARLVSQSLTHERAASEARGKMLRAIAAAIDVRVADRAPTALHVAKLARVLASCMGIRGQELQNIEEGALLHRIGVVSMADSDEARHAPELGAHIAQRAGLPGPVVATIRDQRESFDGTGERRLDGTDIALGARILAVASRYAALTVRDGRGTGHPAACAELRADRRLDPEIVAILVAQPPTAWSSIDATLADLVGDVLGQHAFA